MKDKLKYIFISFLVISISVGYIWLFVTLAILRVINVFYVFLGTYTLSIITSIFILSTKKQDASKLSWIIEIFLFPGLGLIFYFFYGKKFPYIKKRKLQKYHTKANLLPGKDNKYIAEVSNFSVQTKKIAQELSNLNNEPFKTSESFELLKNGSIAFDIAFKEMEKAKHHILLSFYIISDGFMFNSFVELAKRKIKQGVKIYMIYDALGSLFDISMTNISKAKKAGIIIKEFGLGSSFISAGSLINYRYHRKVVIIDSEVAFFGGLNLADNYANLDSKYGYWHDNFVKITGSAVTEIQNLFLHDWHSITKQQLELKPQKNKLTDGSQKCFIQKVENGPDYEESRLEITLNTLISLSEKRFWISTPYLIPPESIISSLKNAALRGVDVRIIMPSLPDKKIVFDLSKENYGPLQEHGVKIYEYQNIFNHAKFAIIDHEISLHGSTNLDNRSINQNFELSAVILSKKANKETADFYEEMLNHSLLVTSERPTKTFSQKLYLSLLKIFTPLF